MSDLEADEEPIARVRPSPVRAGLAVGGFWLIAALLLLPSSRGAVSVVLGGLAFVAGAVGLIGVRRLVVWRSGSRIGSTALVGGRVEVAISGA